MYVRLLGGRGRCGGGCWWQGQGEVVTTFKCINSGGGGDVSEVSAMFVTII